MWKTKNSHSLIVKMQNCTATLQDSLAVFYKAKHNLNIWYSNCMPMYIPTTSQCTLLYMNAFGNFIHNCSKLKATKMSCSRWMVKQNCGNLCNGILYSNKKKSTINLWKDMEELQMHVASERSQFDKATYCMILATVWFYETLERQTYRDKKRSVFTRDSRGRREERRETEKDE